MTQVFDTIESAHEYVGLLLQAIVETASEVGNDLGRTDGEASSQRSVAFRLIAYKLEQLRLHVEASHRQLTDLQALHRLIEAGGSSAFAR
jgi:hypothetical protein